MLLYNYNKMDIPNTDYPLIINNKISHIKEQYNKDDEYLQDFQYIVKEYLIESNNRGLLINHSPGTGKSILAASIADYYRKNDPSRKIIILLSKSLQSNFEANIKKYMKNNKDNSGFEKSKEYIDNVIKDKYKFVSLNASNMYTQISRINKDSSELDFDKQLGKLNEQSSPKFLENSLIIIDESHNLSNSITNESMNAVKLYNSIMNTKNIKIILLTGSPITNSPFELVPTFNLLKGYITSKADISQKGNKKYTLFPENMHDFNEFFIDQKEISIKNKDKFQNRIFGLVSYYGDYYFDIKSKEGFPEQKNVIIEKIPMSNYQYSRYLEVREIENKEEIGKFKKATTADYFNIRDKNKSSSSYRIRSRQVSNFNIPEYALTFKSTRTSVIKHISKIKIEDLKNLDKVSPKFKKIIENIEKYPNKLGVLYSEFVHGEGLNLFALILEKILGYVYWRKLIVDDIDEYDLEKDFTKPKTKSAAKSQKTYAIISGDVPFTERQSIINTFNSKANSTGEKISLLLISKSGAEGISLRNVRHLHIMEPFWNYARIEQIIARGARFMSHDFLPVPERNIQPYIYVTTFPNSKPETKSDISKKDKDVEVRTTDEELLFSALTGKKLIDEFQLAIIETSIDCNINYKKLEKSIQNKLKCKACSPSNEKLYSNDINYDITSRNPCKQVSETTIEAKSIKIKMDGTEQEYFYVKDGLDIKVFEYNDEIGRYIEMKKNNPIYSEIVKKLLKF
jgi:hypothetical protein